jgi:hypothetical protein
MHPPCAGVPTKKKTPWGWIVAGGAALFVLAVLAGLKPSRSRPGGQSPSTSAAFNPVECHYLDTEGMKTKGWKFYGATVENDDWGCLAPYKTLGWAPENNVAYYVNGKSDRVEDMKVEINVYDQTTPKLDREHLASLAEVIYGHAMGATLPSDLRAAILAARPLDKKVNGRFVRVHRQDFVTGKGYELWFAISLTGAPPPER